MDGEAGADSRRRRSAGRSAGAASRACRPTRRARASCLIRASAARLRRRAPHGRRRRRRDPRLHRDQSEGPGDPPPEEVLPGLRAHGPGPGADAPQSPRRAPRRGRAGAACPSAWRGRGAPYLRSRLLSASPAGLPRRLEGDRLFHSLRGAGADRRALRHRDGDQRQTLDCRMPRARRTAFRAWCEQRLARIPGRRCATILTAAKASR
jgi:hypothetical protein